MGHKHSFATILKLKSYKPSREALTKLRLAKELLDHTLVIVKKNNILKRFNSLNSAAKELNVSRRGLNYCMNKRILLRNTYLIIKLTELKF